MFEGGDLLLALAALFQQVNQLILLAHFLAGRRRLPIQLAHGAFRVAKLIRRVHLLLHQGVGRQLVHGPLAVAQSIAREQIIRVFEQTLQAFPHALLFD